MLHLLCACASADPATFCQENQNRSTLIQLTAAYSNPSNAQSMALVAVDACRVVDYVEQPVLLLDMRLAAVLDVSAVCACAHHHGLEAS
jgi:hypothetical protein